MIKILLIVEGPTDQLVLNNITKLFDENKVEIASINGDILKSKEFCSNHKKLINERLNKEKIFNIEDFDEVCLITDTDGCFIDDKYIIIDEKAKNISYNDESIVCSNKSTIAELQIKANNIKNVLNNDLIKIYYNSCNLEHAFGSKRNNKLNEKKLFAKQFIIKYHNNLLSFINLLIEINKSNSLNYNKSWEYIINEFNSLHSSSNLIVFLKEHEKYLKEEFNIFKTSTI